MRRDEAIKAAGAAIHCAGAQRGLSDKNAQSIGTEIIAALEAIGVVTFGTETSALPLSAETDYAVVPVPTVGGDHALVRRATLIQMLTASDATAFLLARGYRVAGPTEAMAVTKDDIRRAFKMAAEAGIIDATEYIAARLGIKE